MKGLLYLGVEKNGYTFCTSIVNVGWLPFFCSVFSTTFVKNNIDNIENGHIFVL